MRQDLLKFISTVDGRFAAKRLTKDYFIKNNKEYLWTYIFEATKDFNQNLTLRERLHIIKYDFKPTKCKFCNNSCMIIVYDGDHRLSEYCSAACSHKESDKKKIGRKTVNEEIAAQKRAKTMIDKYGVAFNLHRPEVIEKLKQPKISDEIYNKLNDYNWLYEQYVTLDKPSTQIGRELGCDYSTVIFYLNNHNISISYTHSTSSHESEIIEWLTSINIKTTQSVKNIINPYEIDILVENNNNKLAIEIDGLYSHSKFSKGEYYHLMKTEKCLEQGLKLIHITDYEWINKNNIVKSLISSRLGLNRTIGARECSSFILTTKEAKEFLNKNHVQGFVSSKVYIGLEYKKQLVAVLSLGVPRFAKQYQWEITRFATMLNINIIGGFTKLFKDFCERFNPVNVITYSDRRFGEGNVYKKANFAFNHSTKPGYFWTNGKDIIPRYKTQKHKLHKLIKNFDPTKSETENMLNNRYNKFWDCGSNVYIWNKPLDS